MRQGKRSRPSTNRSSLAPLFLIGAGVVLVMGVLIWQALRPSAQAGSPAAGQPTQAQSADLPFPEIKRISVADSKAALDEQTAVFLDVRDAGSFSQGHIPGAVNIPLDQIENRASDLNPNQRIIAYCT